MGCEKCDDRESRFPSNFNHSLTIPTSRTFVKYFVLGTQMKECCHPFVGHWLALVVVMKGTMHEAVAVVVVVLKKGMVEIKRQHKTVQYLDSSLAELAIQFAHTLLQVLIDEQILKSGWA